MLKNIVFSEAQLTTLCILQKEAASVMSTDWIASDNTQIPYFRAIYSELVECLDWVGYKWWKKTIPNIEQARMELIDILHFLLSEELRRENGHVKRTVAQMTHNVLPMFCRVYDDVKGNSMHIEDISVQELIDEAMLEVMTHKRLGLNTLTSLFIKLDMTAETVVAMYVGKNILNKFRTSNGQLGNTYAKIWYGREDNEYLMDYINQNADSLANKEFKAGAENYLYLKYIQAQADNKVEFK